MAVSRDPDEKRIVIPYDLKDTIDRLWMESAIREYYRLGVHDPLPNPEDVTDEDVQAIVRIARQGMPRGRDLQL